MIPSREARVGYGLLLAATIVVPIATYVPLQPSPLRQAGAWFSIGVALLVVWAFASRRGPRWARGSTIFGGLLLLSFLPELGSSWLQLQGAAADRAPLLSLWLLVSVLLSWRASEPLRSPWGPLSALLVAFITLLPVKAQIVGERAMARAHDSDEEDPEGRLAEAAVARPWDAEPVFLLGGVAMQLEDWERARNLQASALQADPDHLGARVAAWLIEMLDPKGDADAGFVHLEYAEAAAPNDPDVREARPRWLEAIRDRHVVEARTNLSQGNSRSQRMMCSVFLTEARIALLRGEGPDEVAGKLEQAAVFAEGSARIQVERLARDPDVTEETLAKLCERMWPDWPKI